MIFYRSICLAVLSAIAYISFAQEKMTLLDTWDDPGKEFNDVWGYASDAGEYAIIGGIDSIYIVDVTVPTNIVKLQALYRGDHSTWRDFKVYKNFLYAIADGGSPSNKGVGIFDLSALPGTVTEVNSITDFTRGHNIFVDEANARLYAVGTPTTDDLFVYDLADPANPVLCGSYNIGYIHDIFVRDNIAYCSQGYAGYFIYDLNDCDTALLLGAISASNFDNGYVHSSWNSENDSIAIVATEVGPDPKLYVVDQTDFADMDIVSEWKEPLTTDPGNLANKRPHNPYIIGDYVYVSHYHDGVQVLKIAADTLSRVAYFDTYPANVNYAAAWQGTWGVYPYLPSGSILASNLGEGLSVLRFDTCQLTVRSRAAAGPGTLTTALQCGVDGDTIRLDPLLTGKPIDLGCSALTIDKNISIRALPADSISISGTSVDPMLNILPGKNVTLHGFKLYTGVSSTGVIWNEGNLILEQMQIQHGGNSSMISTEGELELRTGVSIKPQ